MAVVVSEETGVISFVENGEITRYLNSSRLRESIREALQPPRLSEVVRPQVVARRNRRSQRKHCERASERNLYKVMSALWTDCSTIWPC